MSGGRQQEPSGGGFLCWPAEPWVPAQPEPVWSPTYYRAWEPHDTAGKEEWCTGEAFAATSPAETEATWAETWASPIWKALYISSLAAVPGPARGNGDKKPRRRWTP